MEPWGGDWFKKKQSNEPPNYLSRYCSNSGFGNTEKGTQTAGSSTYVRSARLLLAHSTLSLEVEAHYYELA